MATAQALTIAGAADAVGVSAHTLRYYERAGLMLDPVGRTAATHRRYTDEDLSWIVLLTRLRGTGMPIRRMREYADLVRAGEGNEPERLALLEAHRDRRARTARAGAAQPDGHRDQDRLLPGEVS